MFRKLLRGRRGESLVEVLTAGVVFLMLMGTLFAGTRFAAGALRKAEETRSMVFQFQESVRRNLAEGNMDGSAGTLSFGGGSFAVPVRFLTVPASAREADGGSQMDAERTATFYLFAPQEEGDGP